MKKGDKALTPHIDFTGTKAAIEATVSPIEGMTALATDNPSAPIGKYLGGSWIWIGLHNPVEYVDFDLTPSSAVQQGRMQWNSDEDTLDVGMGGGVTGQMFEELFFDAKNQSGSLIANGTPVMFAGTLGASGRTLIQPAIADGSLKAEYMMGLVTNASGIAHGDDGKVTWFGKVRGIDTTGALSYGAAETWADGDLLWVSQTNAGYLTNVEPTSGQKILAAAVIYAHSNGTLLVRPTWNGVVETALYENYYPHRWLPNLAWEYATVAIVSTTKLKITLTAASNLGYYWRGEKVDLGATTLEVTSTDDKAEGIWYCYSRDGVTFELNQTPFYIWDIVSGARRADLMVWEFYWDNTNNTTLWIQPEFHAMFNPALHGYAHESLGTRYTNGLDISYGLTASNNDTRVKLTSGELHDEDISAYITHAASPDDIWEQILGSAGTADANYAALPIYYLSGATPVWRKETANSYPFRPVSNNYIYYNRLNAGSYDYATGISINNYVVYWVVGTTNQTEPIVIIPGRADNATLAAAQAEAFPNLSGLFTEYKLLYRIIYRGLAANTNNGKCQIVSVTDYRKDNISNNATGSGAISAALVSFTPSGEVAATNVQAAIEELDTETVKLTGDQTVAGVKTFSSFPVTPSSAPTTDYQFANRKFITDRWIATVWAGLTRTGNFTFTTTTDITTILRKADCIMLTDTTTKYFVVRSVSAYSGGVCTVTVCDNSNYSLAGNPSNIYYSPTPPIGFPDRWSFSTTWTADGGSAAIGNGSLSSWYSFLGSGQYKLDIVLVSGSTTNFGSGTWRFTIPIPRVSSSYIWHQSGFVLDASTGIFYRCTFVDDGLGKSVAFPSGGASPVRSDIPMTWASPDEFRMNAIIDW